MKKIKNKENLIKHQVNLELNSKWPSYDAMIIKIKLIDKIMEDQAKKNHDIYEGLPEEIIKKLIIKFAINKSMAMRLWSSMQNVNRQVAIFALQEYGMSLIELELLIIAETDIAQLKRIYTYLIKNRKIEEEIFVFTFKSENSNLVELTKVFCKIK